jgi:hypothetical protein
MCNTSAPFDYMFFFPRKQNHSIKAMLRIIPEFFTDVFAWVEEFGKAGAYSADAPYSFSWGWLKLCWYKINEFLCSNLLFVGKMSLM